MKHPSILRITIALTALFSAGLTHGDDKSKITIEEFRAKLKRDETPLPYSSQMQISYADVVDKVLPGVVTITSSGKVKSRMIEDMDQIPPQLQPFFRRFFGLPFDEDEDLDPFGGEDRPGPRRRQTPPRQAPKERQQRLGVGSGIIISADGYIITNNHVVEGADKLEVAVATGASATKSYDAKVIGRDQLTDVALIKIEATGLSQATLGDSGKLRVGDVVLAAGAPMELDRSVSQGIVSALGRKNLGIVGEGSLPGFENFIQTDASINPGNSGGPLVDALGRVVGISTAIFTRTGGNMGIGFAIPINMALKVVEDLIDDGKVQRGWLAVEIGPIDEEAQKVYGLKPDQQGVIVMRLGPGGPAEKAGVQVGDVIVTAGGEPVDSATKLREVVSSKKAGTVLPIEVLREGKKVTLNATLAALPEEALAKMTRDSPLPGGATPDEAKAPGPAPASGQILDGVTVQNATAQLRDQYELPKDAAGVVVTKINPNSSAAAVGIQEGDLIVAINNRPVRSVDEAKAQTTGSSKTFFLKINRKGEQMMRVVRD